MIAREEIAEIFAEAQVRENPVDVLPRDTWHVRSGAMTEEVKAYLHSLPRRQLRTQEQRREERRRAIEKYGPEKLRVQRQLYKLRRNQARLVQVEVLRRALVEAARHLLLRAGELR